MADDEITPARRCTNCGIDWPDDWTLYRTCAGCNCQTRRVTHGNPLTPAEAASRIKHIDFEAYYAEIEERRAQEALRDMDAAFSILLAPDGPAAA